MKQQKRKYEKPHLKSVRLDVKTSVLAVCHTSTNTAPFGSLPVCYLNSACLS